MPISLDLTGSEKPSFKEGQRVFFDLDGKTKGYGRIRGLATTGLLDFWIVEMDMVVGVDRSTYPWSCITIPHSRITVKDPAAEVSIPS